MPSRRFPRLVTSVAEHLARVGRLPLVDALEVGGPPPSADASSASRVKDLLVRTRLRPPAVSFVAAVGALVTALFFVFPAPVVGAAQTAARILFG